MRFALDNVSLPGWLRPLPRQRVQFPARSPQGLSRALLVSGERETLEAELAALWGVRAVRATSSGRAALLLLLRALDAKPGLPVFVSALNFPGVPAALAGAGYEPRFVDIDPASWQLDPRALDEALSAEAEGAVVVAPHLFGAPCDIAEIAAVCRRRGAVLIEDCAHTVPDADSALVLGRTGAGALLSLETSKPISALGGGVAIANTKGLAAGLARAADALGDADGHRGLPGAVLRGAAQHIATHSPAYPLLVYPLQRAAALFGRDIENRDAQELPTTEECHVARLEHWRAALARQALRDVARDTQQRREAAALYRTRLPGRVTAMELPPEPPAMLYYPILVEEPSREAARLLAAGLDTKRLYMRDCSASRCPVAARIAPRLLCLPIYPQMRREDTERVVRTFQAALSR